MRSIYAAVAVTALLCGCQSNKVPEPEVKQPLAMPVTPLVNHILFFDFDKDIPPENAAEILAPHVRHLIQNPNKKILIEGSADESGLYDYNVELGLRRASKINELIMAGGISPEQIIVRSIGIERPLNVQKLNSSLPRNRRVTLTY